MSGEGWAAFAEAGKDLTTMAVSAKGARSQNRKNEHLANLARAASIKEGFRGRKHSRLMQRDAQLFNRVEANKARTWSAKQARRTRTFKRNMSNTAIERRMNDMRRAGINPILAANAVGASTPNADIPASAQASSGQGPSPMGS